VGAEAYRKAQGHLEEEGMSNSFEPGDQLILPFAEKEYVDVARTAHIFGVGISTVYRMAEESYRDGHAAIKLVSYRHQARKRVLYSSIVGFCNFLRGEYGIADRRPRLDHPMLRHRDEDLLPFPLSDTIYSAEALAALGYDDRRPLIYLIEEGRFDAYRLSKEYTWRISRISFKHFLNETRDKEFTAPRSVAAADCL
jgi:hypothetical protein